MRASSCLPSCINLSPRTSPSLNVCGVGDEDDSPDVDAADADEDEDEDEDENLDVVRVRRTFRIR